MSLAVFRQSPTYSKVLEGVKLAKENNADLILAVGGGSVMDCCKAISLGAKYAATFGLTFGQDRA